MGFNTAAIILNDTLHSLGKDPNVGREIELMALRSNRRSDNYGPHGMQSLPSQHADTAQIVVIGGNTIRSLGYGSWRDDDVALLKKLADQLGYRVSRKPQPPEPS